MKTRTLTDAKLKGFTAHQPKNKSLWGNKQARKFLATNSFTTDQATLKTTLYTLHFWWQRGERSPLMLRRAILFLHIFVRAFPEIVLRRGWAAFFSLTLAPLDNRAIVVPLPLDE